MPPPLALLLFAPSSRFRETSSPGSWRWARIVRGNTLMRAEVCAYSRAVVSWSLEFGGCVSRAWHGKRTVGRERQADTEYCQC